MAKAEVNIPKSVFLLLGANVMWENKMNKAKTLLNTNLKNAKYILKWDNADLEFIKDQMTINEVN